MYNHVPYYERDDPYQSENGYYPKPNSKKLSELEVILQIIKNSILCCLPPLSNVGIDTINLILISRFSILSDLVAVQLSMIYLNFFGNYLIYGSFKHFTTKALKIMDFNEKPFKNLYTKAKYSIYLYLLFVAFPMCLLSYYFLDLVFIDKNITIKASQFIHIGSIFMIFNCLKMLNYQVFHILKQENTINGLSTLSIPLHLCCSLLFLYFLENKIMCLAYSQLIIELILFTASTVMIKQSIPGLQTFVSYDFDENLAKVKQYIKNTISGAFTNLLESSYLVFILIFSLFLDYTSLVTNIIMFNIITLLMAAYSGLTTFLSQFIIPKPINDEKNIFYNCFVFLSIFLSFMMATILLVINNNMGLIFNIDDVKFSSELAYLMKYYAVFIFLDCFLAVCDAYIRVKEIYGDINLVLACVYLLTILPISLLLCFTFHKGLIGFWIGYFIFIIIHLVFDLFLITKDILNENDITESF